MVPTTRSPETVHTADSVPNYNDPELAQRTNRNPVHLLLLLLILCVFAANALRWSQAGEDPDLWWHLRTGNQILQHGAVPTTDNYAWPTAGKPWVAYHWLFDLLLVKAYDSGGLHGAIALITFLTIAAMWLQTALLARYVNVIRAIILTGVAQVAMFSLRTPRPWLFTIFFFTLELWLLIEACERRRAVWLIPVVPLMAVWANVHIEFILGLGLIGLFALQQMIPASSKWAFASDEPGRHLSGFWLWGLLGASFVATLANPYGWRLYEVVVEYTTQKAPLLLVSEMQPISFRNFTEWAALLLVCSGWLALGMLPKRPAFLVVLLTVSCWFGFRTQREVWLPVITSTVIIAYRFREPEWRRHPFPRIYWAVAAAATALFTVATFQKMTRSASEMEKAVDEHFPAAASAFVESHAMQGPLYNSYQWGGYLIWRLPSMPVSIDGRANLHGDDRIILSVRTGFAGKDWAADQEFRKAKTIIIEDDSPLASVLRSDTRYRLVYEDKVAAVFEPAQ